MRTSQTRFTTARTAASLTDHAPAWLPGTRPAEAAPQVARESTARIEPVRVKKPRLTSFHSGVANSRKSPPATVSARTSAVTPAGPLTSAPCRGKPPRAPTLAPPRAARPPVGWPADGRLALLRLGGRDL